MRRSHLLFSCVHLLSSLLTVAMGVFLLTLRFSDQLQLILAHHSRFVLQLGVGLITLGLGLLAALFIINRRTYYQVKMEGGKYSVDAKLLRSFLSTYWKKHFPEQNSDLDVIVRAKKRLEILAELPHIEDPEEKEALLLDLEKNLGGALQKKFSYTGDFFLTIR